MDNHGKSLLAASIGMAAGGFTASELTMPPLKKAAVVGLVTAAVIGISQWILFRRKKT